MKPLKFTHRLFEREIAPGPARVLFCPGAFRLAFVGVQGYNFPHRRRSLHQRLTDLESP